MTETMQRQKKKLFQKEAKDNGKGSEQTAWSV